MCPSTRTFSTKEIVASIKRLFKELWPTMAGVGERCSDCLGQADAIRAIVNKPGSANDQLADLLKLRGIGPTIASGLLWSCFPDDYVPFDKHTMGYCTLDWRVIPDPQITDGTYARKCAFIIANLPKHVPPFPAVLDLVRWAAGHRSAEISPL